MRAWESSSTHHWQVPAQDFLGLQAPPSRQTLIPGPLQPHSLLWEDLAHPSGGQHQLWDTLGVPTQLPQTWPYSLQWTQAQDTRTPAASCVRTCPAHNGPTAAPGPPGPEVREIQGPRSANQWASSSLKPQGPLVFMDFCLFMLCAVIKREVYHSDTSLSQENKEKVK